jgi:hypothetical protein
MLFISNVELHCQTVGKFARVGCEDYGSARKPNRVKLDKGQARRAEIWQLRAEPWVVGAEEYRKPCKVEITQQNLAVRFLSAIAVPRLLQPVGAAPIAGRVEGPGGLAGRIGLLGGRSGRGIHGLRLKRLNRGGAVGNRHR